MDIYTHKNASPNVKSVIYIFIYISHTHIIYTKAHSHTRRKKDSPSFDKKNLKTLKHFVFYMFLPHQGCSQEESEIYSTCLFWESLYCRYKSLVQWGFVLLYSLLREQQRWVQILFLSLSDAARAAKLLCLTSQTSAQVSASTPRQWGEEICRETDNM